MVWAIDSPLATGRELAGSAEISKGNLFRRDSFASADTRQTIAQRFEQQVRRHPQRLAVKIGARSLSYAELNRAANRVARAIVGRERIPTETIAVYCGGLAMIVASLAALKAGKAFVPLSPQLPASALKQILAGLDDCPVLTDDSYQGAARKIVGATGRLVNIERVDRKLSARNLNPAISSDSVAYVNFTSGTTGEPKGVVWNHRSELFGIETKTAALKITAGDRISLVRSNNVGAARDMFLALLNGAALIVLDLDARGLASLGDWLREEKITVFTCVATLFRQAAKGAGPKGFPAVRLIHVGGERIFKSDIELYRKYFSDRCRLVCRYSISETQAVSYYFVDKKRQIDGERVPVGYPLPGSDVLILGDDGREVAPGAVGEIAVRSPYLALGYWRQPELTRARFIGAPGDPARMYLTGDLGYRRTDGCLIHLGRKDFQAKVKGHRVELGAVESALNEISAIDHAVVVAEPDAARGSRLVAHVVPRKKSRANISAWRRELKTKLPTFMIPERFVMLRKLPLNAGGKVDRSALPASGRKGWRGEAPVVAPRGAVEKVLAQFWRTALDLDRIGIRDDWASLGGDSLAAAQLAARVGALFPLDASVANLFELGSIADAARFIVDHELQAGQAEKIAAAYLHVDRMSDDAVRRRLGAYRGAGEKDG